GAAGRRPHRHRLDDDRRRQAAARMRRPGGAAVRARGHHLTLARGVSRGRPGPVRPGRPPADVPVPGDFWRAHRGGQRPLLTPLPLARPGVPEIASVGTPGTRGRTAISDGSGTSACGCAWEGTDARSLMWVSSRASPFTAVSVASWLARSVLRLV